MVRNTESTATIPPKKSRPACRGEGNTSRRQWWAMNPPSIPPEVLVMRSLRLASRPAMATIWSDSTAKLTKNTGDRDTSERPSYPFEPHAEREEQGHVENDVDRAQGAADEAPERGLGGPVFIQWQWGQGRGGYREQPHGEDNTPQALLSRQSNTPLRPWWRVAYHLAGTNSAY